MKTRWEVKSSGPSGTTLDLCVGRNEAEKAFFSARGFDVCLMEVRGDRKSVKARRSGSFPRVTFKDLLEAHKEAHKCRL